jgi:hypothetical protein
VGVTVFRRFVALTGVLGVLSIGVVTSTATASAAGNCQGGGSASGPPQVSASHGHGLDAASDFFSVSGTTETDVFIDAFETVSSAGAGASSGSVAFVQISVFDTETGVQSVDAFGCVDNPDFQIDQTLTSARLGPTSLTLVDSITSTSTNATVSVDWTGIGDISRTTQVSHFHSGGFTNIFNFIGFTRLADATGTAADPELNVSVNGAATQASLDKFTEFFIFVCARVC